MALWPLTWPDRVPCTEPGVKSLINYICAKFEPRSLRLCLKLRKKGTTTWGAFAALLGGTSDVRWTQSPLSCLRTAENRE